MKITLAIPKNKKGIRDFLTKELNSAQNIQDSNVKKFVQTSLNRILKVVEPGKVYLVEQENSVSLGELTFHDDNTFTVYDYPLDEFIYHCGKDYKIPETPVNFHNRYLMVVLDQNDATIAELFGNGKMNVLWSDKSHIHGKFKGGGQSSPRFARQREGHRKAWFKKIATKMKDIYYEKQK